MYFRGTLYRALNPVFAREPLSGRGAQIYGGRFNKKGMPALYTSLSIMTALREANQVGSFQPTTLVSYQAEIERIFDCRDYNLLQQHTMTVAGLSDTTWRDQMLNSGIARTQRFADQLCNLGYHGMLVQCFALGATNEDFNMVLWKWSSTLPCRLTLIDDEKRLF